MRTQVTFDAADPHALAAFWASVLSTEVEDHSGFVDQLVADGRMPAEDRITINGRSAHLCAARPRGQRVLRALTHAPAGYVLSAATIPD